MSDILTLARLDSGEFTYDLTTLDLGSVVERADSEMRGVTGRSIGFSREAGLRPALARLSKRGEHDVEGIGLGPSFVGDCRDLLSDGL
ncbi:MAG: hypothetical protein M3O70_22145 [Actinomycetota bacterium]|nr:hypothetical protein [Actinomycetota bacterium]